MQDKKWLVALLAVAAVVVLLVWWQRERMPVKEAQTIEDMQEVEAIEEKIAKVGAVIHEHIMEHASKRNPEQEPLSGQRLQNLESHITDLLTLIETQLQSRDLSQDDRTKLNDYKSHLQEVLAREKAKHGA